MEKFKSKLKEFFAAGPIDINSAEAYLGREISDMVMGLLTAYFEREDTRLLSRQGEANGGGAASREARGETAGLTQLEGSWSIEGHITESETGPTAIPSTRWQG